MGEKIREHITETETQIEDAVEEDESMDEGREGTLSQGCSMRRIVR